MKLLKWAMHQQYYLLSFQLSFLLIEQAFLFKNNSGQILKIVTRGFFFESIIYHQVQFQQITANSSSSSSCQSLSLLCPPFWQDWMHEPVPEM